MIKEQTDVIIGCQIYLEPHSILVDINAEWLCPLFVLRAPRLPKALLINRMLKRDTEIFRYPLTNQLTTMVRPFLVDCLGWSIFLDMQIVSELVNHHIELGQV